MRLRMATANVEFSLTTCLYLNTIHIRYSKRQDALTRLVFFLEVPLNGDAPVVQLLLSLWEQQVADHGSLILPLQNSHLQLVLGDAVAMVLHQLVTKFLLVFRAHEGLELQYLQQSFLSTDCNAECCDSSASRNFFLARRSSCSSSTVGLLRLTLDLWVEVVSRGTVSVSAARTSAERTLRTFFRTPIRSARCQKYRWWNL
jgi:hypothetical protein